MILTEGNPIRGVALAEFGKLLAVDEMEAKPANAPTDGLPRPDAFPPTGPPRLKLAYETLLRAREELLIGFGRANEGGKVGRSVRDALAALESVVVLTTPFVDVPLAALAEPAALDAAAVVGRELVSEATGEPAVPVIPSRLRERRKSMSIKDA